MVPRPVLETVQKVLQESVQKVTPVGGGCIASSFCLTTDRSRYFLKWSEDEVADTFPAEAAGLRALRAAKSPLLIPEPLFAIEAGEAGAGMLLLKWIETGPKPEDFWERFGLGLAEMHWTRLHQYGNDEDNFIGRLPQENGWTDTWPTFFRMHRLNPQAERARLEGLWRVQWDQPFDRLLLQLEEMMPLRPAASVLHGDLWSGNYMVSQTGAAVLIDPAVYYGHRETDLAMTELFGGFERRFYQAYHEAWPVDTDYSKRKEIYNLYHLINHLNHFGMSYAGSVHAILNQF